MVIMAAPLASTAGFAQTAAPTDVASRLPNGASSLNETYQDWQVVCVAQNQGTVCAMTQQQRKKDNNQFVLGIELNTVTKDALKGVVILPFGLNVQNGITWQINDGPASKPQPFSTCLPAGCIVPVTFDTATQKLLGTAKLLKLSAKPDGSDKPVQFSVSLKGFADSREHITKLLNP